MKLREQERAGRPNAKINSARAQQRADDLAERLERRKEDLEQARQISASPPHVISGALVVPAGMVLDEIAPDLVDRRISEQIAMRAVLETEIKLGNDPKDVSAHNEGYDIESRDGATGRLRFIEVKGRRTGAETVTLTKNEILTALNSREQYILALVAVDGREAARLRYVREPFSKEPDENTASVNYNMRDLYALSEEPR